MADSSNYYFRDDLEADKQRKAEGIAPATLAPPVTAPQAPTTAPQDNTFGNLAKAANAVKPVDQKPDYFADFRSSLDSQDPFKQQAKTAITETFKNPTGAFDAAANAQTDKLGREQAAQQEQQRQQAVLAFGGNQTGQVGKTMRAFDNNAIMQQAGLGRDIAAGRAQAAEVARGNAVNQSVALLSEERAGAGQAADIALKQEGQRSQEDIQRTGLSAENSRFYSGIGSQEKIAFAQLSQGDKELAQQAMLSGNELEWKKEATRLGLNDAAADRIWQSAEGEKQRQTQEKLAFAQIGSQEKIQSTQLAFEGAQKELDRSLEKLLSNDKIAAQFQLSDLDRKFQETMQDKGFVQEKDLQVMRDDLEKTLQARGIDAATATQIADQKFTELMAGKDQAFQVQMNDVKQKFLTGERIDSQTWDKAMQAGEMQHEELLTKLSSTLRLEEARNAQVFQTNFQVMQNNIATIAQTRLFTHEQAMQNAAQTFQSEMEKAGYTHEEAMQGARIAAELTENQKNRASQEMMATAQLAQDDDQFQQDIMQRYLFNDQDLDIRKKDMEANLKLMGLQGEQLTMAIQNDKVKSAMDIAALGMEIGDGSPESMAPFVEQFGSALSGYMKEQGIDISKSDFVKAMTTKTTTGTIAPVKGATAGELQKVIDNIDNMADSLPAKVNLSQVKSVISQVFKGGGNKTDTLALASLPGGTPNVYGNKMAMATKSYDTMTPTQAAYDYLGFHNLVKMGVPEKTAAGLIGQSIGESRFKTAYKSLTGKDWTGV